GAASRWGRQSGPLGGASDGSAVGRGAAPAGGTTSSGGTGGGIVSSPRGPGSIFRFFKVRPALRSRPAHRRPGGTLPGPRPPSRDYARDEPKRNSPRAQAPSRALSPFRMRALTLVEAGLAFT